MGEILSERINKTSDFESNPLYSLTIENGVTPKTERYERDFLVRKSEDLFKIVNPNEFVTNPMNLRFGALGYNKNAFKVSVSGYYDVFSIDNNECSSFWKSYFNTSASLRYFDNVATGTLIEKRRVKYSTLREMEFYKPLTIDEKKKIGMYCESLDHLITLHQRKLEKLKIVKKAMLENCFPKNGEKVPKFRFSGFTGDWEQRKVGDHCDMFNGDRSSKYPNTQDMVSDGVPFINAGDLEDGHVNLVNCNRITREKYDDLGGAKLQLGDIVYCLRGTLGKNSYIDNFNEGTVASSLVALRPKNIDGRYLFHVLNSDIEYKQRIVHDEGAAQPNLSAKSVSGFVIPIPDIDEQKKISKFLDGLNNLITLHQRKLEKLKIIKKSFLEKMFV